MPNEAEREAFYPRSIVALQLLTLLLGGTLFCAARHRVLLPEAKEQFPANDDVILRDESVSAAPEATTPSERLLQRWAYGRLLTPGECSNSPLEIVLAIKSVAANRAEREAIRSTWGNETLIPNYATKRVFLLGRSDQSEQQRILEDESNLHGDILQGDFEDTFQNLTLKDYLFLSWFDEKCNAKFIFKGDDDIFLNRFLLKELLDKYEAEQRGDIVIGSVLRNSPRITNDSSKYFVSSDVYRENTYPPYVSGGGFVISASVARKILSIMPTLPPMPIDDAFLGLCLKRAGLTWRLHNNRAFKSWGIHQTDTPLCDILQTYTLHRMEATQLIQVWQQIVDVGSLVDKCQFKQIPAELLKL